MSLSENVIKEYRINLIKIILSDEFSNLYFCYKKTKNIKKYYELLNYIKQNLICNNVDNIELYDCICILVSQKYNKLVINLIKSKTFYCLYKKYYKSINNYNELIDYINKKIECLNIDFSKCFPKPGKMKTVFLLELSAGAVKPTDTTLKNTIEYYWNTYPQEFISCPIVDTKGSLDLNISFLNEYYNLGYRYFVGFTFSNILIGVLEWFNFHSDAIGMTIFGVLTTLSIPKNIYRFLPDDTYRIKPIIPQIKESYIVYYIYQEDLLVGVDVKNILEKTLENMPSPKPTLYVLPANLSTLTVSNISSFLASSTPNSIIITLLSSIRNNYIDLYSNGLTFVGQQYDVLGSYLPIIPSGTASNELNDRYNVLTFNGVNTSILWRNGYKYLGSNNYNITALNVLNLLNTFSNNKLVNNINSHYGILQFDPATKDTLYPNILLQKYNDSKYVSTKLFIVDPILGTYGAIFTNPAPEITNIPIPSYKPYGKAIALLELTNYSNNIDTIYQQSLYFYWYNNPDFKPFPIIDTKSSIPYTLELLNKYYDEGYRIFLGFSRSSVLITTLKWFDEHPDTVGISVWSAAIDLRIKKNVYRMDPSDNYIVESITPELEKAKTVYYIYTGYELASLNVLKILKENPKINLKTYAIEKDNVNLTVSDLNKFFVGSNDEDVTLLYIFDEQPYFNLYNENPPLIFSGYQYDIINGQTPKIYGTGQETLNNKLYYLQSIYPNTTLLWRENANYLTKKYETETTSSGLCNALSMINYFLQGKNIKLLGSYSGVLQFDPITKDIMFPSYLKRVYKKEVDNFIKYSIIFDDPLLGNFDAQFII